MNSCICTRCADQERVLAALRRAVAPKEPAVVVGGRYVVGENPTYRGVTGKSLPLPTDMAGCSVEVTAVDGDTGDVLVRSVMGHEWIDPGHLTPAPDPAAAPAVDDELLRDIHRAAGIGSAWSTKPEQFAARLLASEPMQRLRAAWAAEAVRSGDVVERAQYDHVLTEAKVVERERDEARAELDQLHSWDGLMRLLAEHWPADVFGDGSTFSDQDDPGVQIVNLIHMVSKARATVERLRAAQQLTDVDTVPVTTVERLVEDACKWLSDRLRATRGSTSTRPWGEVREEGRRIRAALDAEPRRGLFETPQEYQERCAAEKQREEAPGER